MHNKRISKQKIFDTARVIAHLDKEPTLANVREYLAFTGSQTTLHKYLKEWRLECFKAYDPESIKEIVPQEMTKLQTENHRLTETVAKMEGHSRIVANEFAKTERKNVELTQQIAKLEIQLSLLDKEYKELKKDKEHLNIMYQDLKEERAVLLGKMERDKDQLIASLREELSQTHQANLQKIQEVSYSGHDMLMQEKVKVINLEEKAKIQASELAKLQQDFNDANRIVEPLKSQIKQLEKLIAENVTIEQLKEYEKKQKLFAFTSNEV